MANHTPLPWGVEPNDPSYLVLGGEVVGMLAPGRASKEEAAANAELVVRAVNSHGKLLDALKWAEAMLTVLKDNLPNPDTYDSCMAGVRNARAAIDAADGR